VRTPRVSLRKIGFFVTTAEMGSISAASHVLNVSPAALSEALADLEKDIEVDVFIRHKARGVTLTASGRRLLTEARRLLRHAEEFQALAGGPGDCVSGELTVGCFPSLLPFVIPNVLVSLRSRHPDLKLGLVEDSQDDLERAMLDGEIDMSVMYDLGIGPKIKRQQLFVCKPYVLLSPKHRLAAMNGPLDLALLVDDPLIQIDVQPGLPPHLFYCQGLTPRVAYRTTNYELVRALVARDFGYAILAHCFANNQTYEGLPLVLRPIANQVPPLSVVLAWPSELHLQGRTKGFVDFCIELFKDRPQS